MQERIARVRPKLHNASLSEAFVLRLAADSILESNGDLDDHIKFIVEFCHVLVELVKAMEERLLGRTSSSLQDRSPSKLSKQILEANGFLFLSLTLRIMPHMKLEVARVIHNLMVEKKIHAAGSLIGAAKVKKNPSICRHCATYLNASALGQILRQE